MKKIIVITLEIDTEDEPSYDQIKTDIETELNCAGYFYTMKDMKITNDSAE